MKMNSANISKMKLHLRYYNLARFSPLITKRKNKEIDIDLSVNL